MPRTGFKAKRVSGYVPAFLFFDCLRNREFPATITLCSSDKLDYLPEQDIFHDITGHVPMHTDIAFTDTMARFFWFSIEFGLMQAPLVADSGRPD